nr:hypothetical protein [Morchella crassipes]
MWWGRSTLFLFFLLNKKKKKLKYGYSNFSLEILEYCEKEKAISRCPCPCPGTGRGGSWSWSCWNYIDLRPVKREYNILPTAGFGLPPFLRKPKQNERGAPGSKTFFAALLQVFF